MLSQLTSEPHVALSGSVLVHEASSPISVVVAITTTWAGFAVAGVPEGTWVSWQLVGAPYTSTNCINGLEQGSKPLTPHTISMGTVQTTGPGDSLSPGTALLGLGPGKVKGVFASPLVVHSPVWHLIQNNYRVALGVGLGDQSCASLWCWSPMTISNPTSPNAQYVVALAPSPESPWTSAVLDLGRWFSVLPNASTDNAFYLLKTSTGCVLTVDQFETTTSTTSSSTVAILGASMGIDNANFALDVHGLRFGRMVSN